MRHQQFLIRSLKLGLHLCTCRPNNQNPNQLNTDCQNGRILNGFQISTFGIIASDLNEQITNSSVVNFNLRLPWVTWGSWMTGFEFKSTLA